MDKRERIYSTKEVLWDVPEGFSTEQIEAIHRLMESQDKWLNTSVFLEYKPRTEYLKGYFANLQLGMAAESQVPADILIGENYGGMVKDSTICEEPLVILLNKNLSYIYKVKLLNNSSSRSQITQAQKAFVDLLPLLNADTFNLDMKGAEMFTNSSSRSSTFLTPKLIYINSVGKAVLWQTGVGVPVFWQSLKKDQPILAQAKYDMFFKRFSTGLKSYDENLRLDQWTSGPLNLYKRELKTLLFTPEALGL